jgi:hypothetical protein
VERLPLGPIVLHDECVAAPPGFGELRRQAEAQEARRRACAAGEAFAAGGQGAQGWPEPWPQLVLGDGVRFFDEVSAAAGALGRFTGASAMTVVKQLCGRAGQAD